MTDRELITRVISPLLVAGILGAVRWTSRHLRGLSMKMNRIISMLGRHEWADTPEKQNLVADLIKPGR